jgi:hypothetical protein
VTLLLRFHLSITWLSCRTLFPLKVSGYSTDTSLSIGVWIQYYNSNSSPFQTKAAQTLLKETDKSSLKLAVEYALYDYKIVSAANTRSM